MDALNRLNSCYQALLCESALRIYRHNQWTRLPSICLFQQDNIVQCSTNLSSTVQEALVAIGDLPNIEQHSFV